MVTLIIFSIFAIDISSAKENNFKETSLYYLQIKSITTNLLIDNSGKAIDSKQSMSTRAQYTYRSSSPPSGTTASDFSLLNRTEEEVATFAGKLLENMTQTSFISILSKAVGGTIFAISSVVANSLFLKNRSKPYEIRFKIFIR